MKTHKLSLFIFHRSLRLTDNTALIAALQASEQVIPCFIFDPRQVEKNSYKADHGVQFMLESLQDLAEQLKKKGATLYYFYGKQEEVVKELVKKLKIDAVFAHKDYTPFAQKRSVALKQAATPATFVELEDYLLFPIEQIKKADGNPYTVFTPYYKKSLMYDVALPKKNISSNYYTKKIALAQSGKKIFTKILPQRSLQQFVQGGRRAALVFLKKLSNYKQYATQRDLPFLEGTTGLSAHNKFGTVSIREVYYAIKEQLGEHHPLLRQLVWRDFFTQIAYHFPHVFTGSFYKKYDKVTWESNASAFKKWQQGMTGFPIVDAGMRELNQTGWMHNRVRMIVASFLTKDLLIDWRKGEKYFAQQLIDYDPSVNNGSWQWAASTGCDAAPYFRVFNPWLQQKKFDPGCKYIKQWIPELQGVDPTVIHKLDSQEVAGYPQPLVDHKVAAQRAKDRYKQALK